MVCPATETLLYACHADCISTSVLRLGGHTQYSDYGDIQAAATFIQLNNKIQGPIILLWQPTSSQQHATVAINAAPWLVVVESTSHVDAGSSRPVASAGSNGDVRLGTSRPLPKVQGSGRPKGTALAGIAFGGNFRDHVGRRATRRQVNEATAQVAAARFVRAQQPIAGKQIKSKDRR
jgi:hypothetical protein